MDGIFVPSISFGLPVIQSLRKQTELFFDLHLMITKPEKYIKDFMQSGANLITFHLEATKNPKEVIRIIKENGIKVGISIKPNTAVTEIIPYLDLVDMVLIMTVEPGFGGQTYIDDCTHKVIELKEILNRKKLNVDIEVDGGISLENLKTVLDAGANIIVAGSSIFKNNIEKNVIDFLEIMK